VVAPVRVTSMICNAAGENHWPRLRAIICQRETNEKKIRDRNAREDKPILVGKIV